MRDLFFSFIGNFGEFSNYNTRNVHRECWKLKMCLFPVVGQFQSSLGRHYSSVPFPLRFLLFLRTVCWRQKLDERSQWRKDEDYVPKSTCYCSRWDTIWMCQFLFITNKTQEIAALKATHQINELGILRSGKCNEW